MLASIVADDYVLKAENPVEAEVTFYDTFDWRLFNKSMVLCQSGNKLVVQRLPTGSILESLASGSPSSFVWELGDSPLKRSIESVVGDRRLFRVGEAYVRTAPYRVLNVDGKTVARLLGVEVRAGLGAKAALLDAHIALQAVRGYPGHFQQLAAKFGQAGLIASGWQETFRRIVAAEGIAAQRQPGYYSAKPDYQLEPGARADEAAKTILRQTLAVMRANEAGIKADWDTEFLHDFRTAVRRTRSALSQIPGVFGPEITARFKEAFGLLGESSNRLRDLDVYLLSESDYRALLPDAMREDIAPLFDYLREQRGQALQETIDELNSARYAAMMDEWDAFLHEPVPDAPSAPNANVPIDDVARRQISKRYRQVIKDGNQIRIQTQDEDLHRLRIDCKKLRYLIEFFASLFPQKEIGTLVGQLKLLQDDLGVYNDLSVQQAYLMQISDVLPASDARGRRGLVAIGFLVEKLAAQHQAMRPELAKAFEEFAAPRNRELYRRLFRNDEGMVGS
jgi:CHAD domain-containing protein